MHKGNTVKTVDDLCPKWFDIIVELGKKGKTQMHIRKELGIGQTVFERLRREDDDFKQACKLFQLESSIYWTDLAQNHATGQDIGALANANILKYNILNRPFIGWTDKQVVEQETTVKADESATDLFKAMLASSADTQK